MASGKVMKYRWRQRNDCNDIILITGEFWYEAIQIVAIKVFVTDLLSQSFLAAICISQLFPYYSFVQKNKQWTKSSK